MMKIWGLTDIGLVRKQNQDAYGVDIDKETGQVICVVCDGMGGPVGGDIASRIAVDTFLETVKANLRMDMGAEQIRELSSYATSLANAAIRDEVRQREEYQGMGTTLVAAVSYQEGVVVSNVGDSRAYLINAQGIRRISKDHSLVEELVDLGDITEAEARTHPKRNYITRALGPEESTLCDGFIVPLERGEFVLLCTDGLVETVSDQEMFYEVQHAEDLNYCLQRLLEISKRSGAPDNVTAVLLQQL